MAVSSIKKPMEFPLAVANGGTGSTTAANARTALGVPADSAVVHNTGTEHVGGTKYFDNSIYIKNSATNPCIYFQGKDENVISATIHAMNAEASDSTYGSVYLRFQELSPDSNGDSTGFYERYHLPAVATGLTENKAYNILTTKSRVSIAQGGTGQNGISQTTATGNGITATIAKWGKVVNMKISGSPTADIALGATILTIPSGYRPFEKMDGLIGVSGSWGTSGIRFFSITTEGILACHSAISKSASVFASVTYFIP